MKKFILFVLMISLLSSCVGEEIPGGKAVVTNISFVKYPDENSRIYKVTLIPVNPMDYGDVEHIFYDSHYFIIYTDSLVAVGDTIDILK